MQIKATLRKDVIKYSKFILQYMLLISTLFVVTVLDILQRTPWNSILYKESVTLRGDFGAQVGI
jgi:hypothetical protein